jgi:hypothetical protein
VSSALDRRTRYAVLLGVALALGSAGALAIVACSSDLQSELPPPFDAAGSDAPRDSSAADVANAAVVDAPSGPFCTVIDASSLVLCDDFESESAPLFGFDESTLVADGGSSLSISDEGGTTNPTRVLDVKLTQKADAGQSAFLTKNLPDAGAPDSFLHYEVELDFRIVGAASLAYVALASLQFPGGPIKEHGFAVYDGNVFARLVPKDFAVKDDKSLWHHARIVLDRPKGSTPSSFTTTISIDGTLVDNVGGVDPGTTGGSKVRVGAFATSATAAGSIRAQFDNAVIRRW